MEQVPPTAYERTKSWRLRNPEKVKELNKKYRDKPENKAKKKEYNKKHKVKLAEQRKEVEGIQPEDELEQYIQNNPVGLFQL